MSMDPVNENKYLSEVLALIDEKIEELDALVSVTDRDMEEFHEYFWNSYTEFDEYGYELYDNTNAIRQKIRQKGDYIRDRYTLVRMKDSPYFGRVDFVFDGESDAESLYIGISNLAGETGTLPLVFDWRAPVSSLFYDYDVGPAAYEAPMGQITGSITHKYQYKIASGRIVYMLESDLKVDDEILKAELGKNASASLKSIVTTIQREQNEIIRDKGRALVVQGCAGSGKTSIALHRIAYLLYHNRNQLKASQVLILSPNSLFADYISRILPELGEENISETSLDIWAYHRLAKYGEAQDRYERIEEIINPESRTVLASEESAYKQTRDYVEELDGFLLDLESEGVDISDFRYHGRTYTAGYITGLFYEKLWNIPFMDRMSRIAEFIIDEEETRRNADMSAEEKQLITERLNSMYTERDLIGLYNSFLKTTGRKPLPAYITGVSPAQTIEEPDEDRDIEGDSEVGYRTPGSRDGYLRVDHIPYEDVYPILYLKYSLFEKKENRPVRHMIIDEMQDYSYLQYRLISMVFDCPMTILGDRQQTLEGGEKDVTGFLHEILGKDIHTFVLDKSYRSTVEITEYASAIAGLSVTGAIDRHGEAVKEADFDSEAKRTKYIAERLMADSEEYDTVAVLCSNADRALEVYEGLLGICESKEPALLTGDTTSFKTGISVLPYYLSKGLEFDSVFIVDDPFEPEEMHRQALYIGATRALHKLEIVRMRR